MIIYEFEIKEGGKVRLSVVDDDGLKTRRTGLLRQFRDAIREQYLTTPDSLPVGTIGRISASGSIQWNNNAGLPKVGRPRLNGFAPMTGVERARKRRALLRQNKIEKD